MAYNKSKAFAGIGTVLSRGGSGALAPPPAPTLSQTSGGSLLARDYYVVITLSNATGETLTSNETHISALANNVVTVKSPAAVGNATKYDVYIGTASGVYTKQTTTSETLGTDWTEPTTGLIAGTAVPATNTTDTFTEVAEVKSIQQTGSKADTVDVTNMQSTGGFREWLATLRDAGEINFTANKISNDATQRQLLSDFNQATQAVWQITFPPESITDTSHTSPAVFSANAWVTSQDADFPTDKEATVSAKLKITGQPTLTDER